MLSFLKPAPAIDRLPPENIDPEYRRLRLRVFEVINIAHHQQKYVVFAHIPKELDCGCSSSNELFFRRRR